MEILEKSGGRDCVDERREEKDKDCLRREGESLEERGRESVRKRERLEERGEREVPDGGRGRSRRGYSEQNRHN